MRRVIPSNLPYTSAQKISNDIRLPAAISEVGIMKYLESKRISPKQGHACITITCPKYSKTKLSIGQMNQVFINKMTGNFVCRSCKQSGDWKKLSDNISTVLSTAVKQPSRLRCFAHLSEQESEVPPALTLLHENCCEPDKVKHEELEYLLKELGMPLIRIETLQKMSVLVMEGGQGLLFPVYDVESKIIAGKTMEIKYGKIVTKTYPRLDFPGLFGWSTARQRKNIVLVASEVDALTVHQEIPNIAAICLPKGVSTLPQEMLPYLEFYDKITIWFNNDLQSFSSAKLFSKKLGEKRTLIIRPESGNKSPYKALEAGLKLKKIYGAASSVQNTNIISFSAHREAIKHELSHAVDVAGVKWSHYPKLNELLKGHRRGELTVFTGGTGSGKTTFISDYSLDLCLQGVNTLWGSFEINNVKLMKMMLQQFSRKNLSNHMNEFDGYADSFEQLQMFFMNFHGQENIKNVIETMSHAVYVHDITHVIVDNLQFMMGSMDSNYDRFAKQDIIVGLFRSFATTMNCHVTLVIHPRKEEAEELTTSSIFGGAKASQEADNILILQRTGVGVHARKYLQVTKNRFDGQLGSMALRFNKETLGFYKLDSDKQTAEPNLEGLSSIPADKIENIMDKFSDNNSHW